MEGDGLPVEEAEQEERFRQEKGKERKIKHGRGMFMWPTSKRPRNTPCVCFSLASDEDVCEVVKDPCVPGRPLAFPELILSGPICVNRTPTTTARTELHSMITFHHANTRGSRAGRLRNAHLCVPETIVINV